ncbi:MAG: DUF2141 domain-containing protein [Bacteriovoracaceae bacterium]|nr:DUF2141 domain-containing protein [Bacteriovoracaceae bacterium]
MILTWLIFSLAQANTQTLKLCFKNLKEQNAIIQIAIHNSPETFLKEDKTPYRIQSFVYHPDEPCTDLEVPPGRYAIAFFHDENDNQKLDENFLGIPNEAFGFSKNPKITFGPPTFNDVVFETEDALNLELIFKRLL